MDNGTEVISCIGPITHTWKLTGALELHRLIFDSRDLEKQKDEITNGIIDSTCVMDDGRYTLKEVSQPPLPLLPGHATVPRLYVQAQ